MIPQFQKLKLPLDQKQIDAFNVLLSQLRDLLTGKLTFAENTTTSIVRIEFQAPNMPRTPSSVRPTMVVNGGLVAVGGNNPASVAQTTPFQWAWSNGTITIPSLAGLSGTGKYAITVLVVRG